MRWTPEQEEAIYKSGTDILVAAAAGSGKTAVLVERIIQKLLNPDNQTDIDSLLVVTFTNAAAQEMRHRVGAALEKALETHPGSIHLKKQLSLLQRASISTLHSFCMEVVRKYSYRLDLDPHFRIADQIEGDLIKQEILEELFEDWYGKEGEERDTFFEVVDRFSNDRSDIEVESLVTTLHTFAMQNPWPSQWLEDMVSMYEATEEVAEDDIKWLSIIKHEVKGQLEAMLRESEKALEVTRLPDGPYHYAEAFDDHQLKCKEALALTNRSWQELHDYIQANGTLKALSRKKADCSDELKEEAKAWRDRYKKRWETLKNEWFGRSLESYLKDMVILGPVINQLVLLVKEFHERYQKRKKEKALVDFADLEHFCLQILMDETSTPDDIRPSDVAVDFHQKFTELLIDEYQDTNLVQETILQLLTAGDESAHLFMVGDVKQSIYRFRHAEPSLFISKYKRFANEEDPSHRIDLARNFRSRQQVLSATNYIFRQILDEEVGEINYNQDAELIFSNSIYDQLTTRDANAELMLIDREQLEEQTDDREDYRDLEKAQLEGRSYARLIKTWIGQGEEPPLEIVDKETETLRPPQYRDIVILLRSMTWAPTIVEELKQQGIPVYADLSTGYFEAIEIQVMLSLLKVIDNPQQDIPLAAVLRSPLVGLNEDELTQIRLAEQKGTYYQALKNYIKLSSSTASTYKKIEQFWERLEAWRIRARQGSLSELIWQIYRETGYYDFVGGIPGGKQRQANLRALYDRARTYEATSFRGLFRFLRFIERIEERGEDLGAARALGEQEDVVRIMTIHKSKGLEFPFVILGAMDKEFNKQDLKEKYLLHKDIGFGAKYIDPQKRIMYPTLAYHALKKQMQRELIAEEMRVLYVALTRAKEKIVMVGNVPSFQKKQTGWQAMLDHQEWLLPAPDRLEAKSYLDWVAPALIRHNHSVDLRGDEALRGLPKEICEDESCWKVTILHASELVNPETVAKTRNELLEEAVKSWTPIKGMGKDNPEVNNRLAFRYQHEQATTHRAKQSVTEIKRQRELKDDYSDQQLIRKHKQPIVKRPRFMQAAKALSATERGSAMHTVMQHLPLTSPLTKGEIEEYVEAFVERELLLREEADVIDFAAIEAFFQTEIAEKMREASGMMREVPFSLTLLADEVYQGWPASSEERVLIQGVIDCLIPDGDGWILLDYKTDYIQEPLNERELEKLKKRYEIQLSLYGRAVERILKKPVKSKYLYFFDGQRLLDLTN